MIKSNPKPSCFARKLGNEACFHTCPVSDECYKTKVISEPSLGEALRQAFEDHGANRVKRCIGTRGLWYVYI